MDLGSEDLSTCVTGTGGPLLGGEVGPLHVWCSAMLQVSHMGQPFKTTLNKVY